METAECWAGHFTVFTSQDRGGKESVPKPTHVLHFSESPGVPRAPQSPYALLSGKPVKILGDKGIKGVCPRDNRGAGKWVEANCKHGAEHQRGTQEVERGGWF